MKRWFNNQAKHELISNSISALVVFLVALPLCIGIAAACGLTPDKGIIAGVIGGIVVGLTGGVMYMDPSAKDIIESWRRRVSGGDNQS